MKNKDKGDGAKRTRFMTVFTVEVETEVSEDLLEEVLKEDWQSTFYKLPTKQDIANHIAYNFARNGIVTVNALDGFAHRSSSDAGMMSEEWTIDDVDSGQLPPLAETGKQ